jgi:hypothetical protein
MGIVMYLVTYSSFTLARFLDRRGLILSSALREHVLRNANANSYVSTEKNTI